MDNSQHDILRKAISMRHNLHRYPELSGYEAHTACLIREWFADLKPDISIGNVAGNGLAYVFGGKKPRKTFLFRCDMDAVLLNETSQTDHVSLIQGISHGCGHDGHMAIMCAAAALMAKNRPSKDRVIFAFQPAEEVGAGGPAFVSDPRIIELKPDIVYAIHNFPKYRLGNVLIRKGLFHLASTGMEISMIGKESHASRPEDGVSPVEAIAKILRVLKKLEYPAAITHLKVGEPTMGITPGYALIQGVLRANTALELKDVCDRALKSAKKISKQEKLNIDVTFKETFDEVVCDDKACDIVLEAAKQAELEYEVLPQPMRCSEDFSAFTNKYPGAMIGLGSGVHHPQLHNPDYDFPDCLIEPSVKLIQKIIENSLT